MEKKKGFDIAVLGTPHGGPATNKSKKYKVKRKNFCLLPFTFCLFLLAGCGDQMARIDENQLQLQAMVEANAQQIAVVAARIEQSLGLLTENQQELQVGIENVQSDVRKVAVEVATVADEQMKLHENVQSNSRQMANQTASIEQSLGLLTENQQGLQAGIQDVQNDTRKVAAEVAAVTQKQAKLYATVQDNSRQVTEKVALVEQSLGLLTEGRQERQTTIDGMEQSIQQVAVGINALGEDVLKLQEILQNNIRELVSVAEVTGRDQLKFQQKIQNDLLALDDSLSAVKQSMGLLTENQGSLQSRLEDMQTDARIMSTDVPQAIAKLRDDLDELSRNNAQAPVQIEEIEPPPQSSASAETNSVD